MVAEAQADLAEAQAAFEGLDTSDPEAVRQLFENLLKAQNALADAQNQLIRTKDILTKEQMAEREEQMAELEDQIAQLEDQIEDLNDQLAEVSVVDISNYEVTMKTSFPYTGKAIEPDVKVTGLNGSCYTVSYSNNKKVGTAEVIISAKGDGYKGTIKKTFKIVKASNTLKIKGKTATVKYSKLNRKAQILKTTRVIKFTSKGQGARTYAKVSGSKKISISKKTGKVTVKKGLKKGTYKVKVKVTAKGDATHKKTVKSVTFKVKIK